MYMYISIRLGHLKIQYTYNSQLEMWMVVRKRAEEKAQRTRKKGK